MATMSRSPKRVLAEALAVGKQALPDYSHKYSPKKFTQPQLFACLVLKELLKIDYRGLVAHLSDAAEWRETIQLKSVPHFTTVEKAGKRLLKAQFANRLLQTTLKRARRKRRLRRFIKQAAIDSSGFEAHHASRYFVRRCGKGQKSSGKKQSLTYRRFPKMAVISDCKSHLILGLHFEHGPTNDLRHFGKLFCEVWRDQHLQTLYADAGYDAEWVHEVVREEFGVRAIIPAQIGRPTAQPPTGRYRRWMSYNLHRTNYGQRWQVETVFSMMKRRLGSTLGANSYWSQRRAAWLKAIAHNILILWPLHDLFYRAGMTSLSVAK
jgi:hypothetical protein